jgi:hypothetical protein
MTPIMQSFHGALLAAALLPPKVGCVGQGCSEGCLVTAVSLAEVRLAGAKAGFYGNPAETEGFLSAPVISHRQNETKLVAVRRGTRRNKAEHQLVRLRVHAPSRALQIPYTGGRTNPALPRTEKSSETVKTLKTREI